MPAPTPPRANALSFVAIKPEGGFDYWNVTSSGSWAADCDQGKALGTEYLTFVGDHPTNGNATLLGCIVSSMVDNAIAGRRARGAEIGFMRQINEYAMAVAAVVERPDALRAA